MTEPGERQAEAASDREPAVNPEVISDLDVPDEDAKHIAGASLFNCGTH
jgi:hypothetical protein